MHTSSRHYVLVSDALTSEETEALEAIARASDGRWSILKANVDTDAGQLPLEEIGVIYISVDVLGESSKMQLTRLMSLFCEVALKSPSLQWLQASSAGLDRPQYQALLERGVAVTHAGGIAATTVAHSAVAGLLALGRDLPRFMSMQHNRQWMPARGPDAPQDISGQTAIVVGLGAIGREIARLCIALGLHVTGFNRSGICPPNLDIEVHGIAEFDDYVGKTDWLILSCPLTEETRHLVEEQHFRCMKPSARLVDVSRGGVVDSAALLTALREGALAGAYLDVFETEPLPADSPFWTLPNTIITPHAAGDSAGRGRKLTELFIKNLERHVSGRSLINKAESKTPATRP
ncbi:MAG: D-2-hydroxyacid dehydrogenase [Pusillimonas sp.]